MNIYDFERMYAEIEKDVKANVDLEYFANLEKVDKNLSDVLKNKKIDTVIARHAEKMTDEEIRSLAKYLKNFKVEKLSNSLDAIGEGYVKESIKLEMQICKRLTSYNQLIMTKNARKQLKAAANVKEEQVK